MDNASNTSEEIAFAENDEIDGSVLSRIRKKRGVKVTGKYIPPLEWEKKDPSNSSFWNHSNFVVYDDMADSTNYTVQTVDNVSTKLHVKEERQSSLLTNNGRKDTTKMEQEKQRKGYRQVKSPEAVGAKNTNDLSQEKIEEKTTDDKQIAEKGAEDMLPLGSAIPKETIEELKNLLKESPLIRSRLKHNPKYTTMLLPKVNENLTEKSALTFETFKPNSESDNKKISPLTMPETIQTHDAAPEEEEKAELHHDGNHSLKSVKLNTSIGKELDLGSNNNSESISSRSGIQNSLVLSLGEQIKQQIAREDIRFVRFEAADLHGVSRSKIVPACLFHEKAINGIYMPRSRLDLTMNTKDNEAGQKYSIHFNSDIVMKPDLATFSILPWAEKTSRVLCDTYTVSGDPLLTSPRHLAKRQLYQLQENGFSLHSAFVYDFCAFVFAEMINSKSIAFPAATLLTDHDQLFMQELFDGMYSTGGSIESFSSVTGPGQMQISFQPEYGLKCADNAFTFRTGLKEIAKKHGYIASFYADTGGFYNSGLLSHSLWNANCTKNMFFSESEDLTDIGKKWISGLLVHSAALSCLAAPGVSCRKHFSKDVKDSQDSICATWGSNDNSRAYNIKYHGSNGTYIENKLGSATANPYLVFAATIAAGLDGLKRNLNFFNERSRNADVDHFKACSIPLKLEDALLSLEEDKYITAALGEEFIQHFVAVKRHELETESLDADRNTFLEYFV